ncbi:MAG: transglycosylase SLT domain-containing protein, partial [Patescibacteria group bacterium]|nr:transglycosylase SLT domain-containing protein [Patescibacteria group bacterium]
DGRQGAIGICLVVCRKKEGRYIIMSDEQIKTLAEKYAPLRGLPIDLLLAQIAQESGTPGQIGTGNPSAVSAAGAVGLMQVEPATALDLLTQHRDLLIEILKIPEVSVALGSYYDVHDCLDAAGMCHLAGLDVGTFASTNIPSIDAAGMCHLAGLDGLKGMLAAYNGGAGRLHEAYVAAGPQPNPTMVEFSALAPHLPSETSHYVGSIIETWQRSSSQFGVVSDPEICM